MYDGKKVTAEKIVYDAIEKIKTKSKDEPINIFNEAINNIKPTVEVRTGVETDMDCINDGLKTAHTAVLLAPVAIEVASAGLAIPTAIPGSLIPLAAEISK